MSRFKLCRSLILPVLVLGLWGVPAYADCTGSGTTWTCAAGTTISQLATRYSSASDGATFTFASGSYTWNSTLTFSLTKAVTLICASSCTVSTSGTVFSWPSSGGTTSKAYRISGFTMSHSGGDLIWTCPGGGCSALTVSALRFDHNTVVLSGSARLMSIGVNDAVNHFVYGVFDHNALSQASTTNYFITNSATSPENAPPLGSLGGANNLFIEDNTFTTTSLSDSGAGCIDNNGGGAAFVFRFNTATNCRVLSHGTGHAWGPINQEWYGNRIIYNSNCSDATGICDGYHMIHHQGAGTYMVFGNRLTNKPGTSRDTGNSVVVMHHGAGNNRGAFGPCDGTQAVDGNRSPIGTYAGYPCHRQPGRDRDDMLYPMFGWDNRWAADNVIQPLAVDASYGANTTKHIVANRDLYNYTASFDGTTGMGVGTLAARPSNCTTGTEAGDAGRSGVGYWATDQGTWKTATPSQGNTSVENGVLYLCTATNTWSVYYTPYTYPHPLVGGTDTTPPAAPTGVTILSMVD